MGKKESFAYQIEPAMKAPCRMINRRVLEKSYGWNPMNKFMNGHAILENSVMERLLGKESIHPDAFNFRVAGRTGSQLKEL